MTHKEIKEVREFLEARDRFFEWVCKNGIGDHSSERIERVRIYEHSATFDGGMTIAVTDYYADGDNGCGVHITYPILRKDGDFLFSCEWKLIKGLEALRKHTQYEKAIMEIEGQKEDERQIHISINNENTPI